MSSDTVSCPLFGILQKAMLSMRKLSDPNWDILSMPDWYSSELVTVMKSSKRLRELS